MHTSLQQLHTQIKEQIPMNDACQPQAIHLKDYTFPNYRVHTVKLEFELDPDCTVVQSQVEYLHVSGKPNS